MKILNSSNYSQGSLSKDKEIDNNIIHKLIEWKKNPKINFILK